MITGEQKFLAIFSHTAYLLGGIGFILAPLIIFLLKKDDHFVYEHAKQALITHFLLLIFSTIVGFLTFLLIGILLFPVVAILFVGLFITSLLAAYKALQGEYYQYPLVQGIISKF